MLLKQDKNENILLDQFIRQRKERSNNSIGFKIGQKRNNKEQVEMNKGWKS